jgi:uncharacterized protein (DUF433 family)
MQPARIYVREDEHGVLRVGDSRVMLDSVVVAFHLGHSAETIAQQYPALTLEEVYGAITYYLAHRADVDQYLRNQDEVWKQWREKAHAAESPVVQRLRALAARTRTNAQRVDRDSWPTTTSTNTSTPGFSARSRRSTFRASATSE